MMAPPSFFVLIFGDKDTPELQVEPLSKHYTEKPPKNSMELVVNVYNICYSEDKEILKRSRTLREYSMFIYFVNEYLDREMSLEEAVAASVKRAKKEGILVDFLNKYATEVEGMLTGITVEKYGEVMKKEGFEDGILEQRPTLVNLQCDVDHPTQCMADMLHVIHYFGGVENLKGKKVAMTWAYSPSYGKPLSVPQGVIGLFTRFGMDVTLAHPEGYDVFPEVEEIARKNCEKYGSKFHKTNSMAEAFKDADIVYPKSWAPFKAMEKRSELYVKGDQKGIDELEKELLAQNAEHKDWTCSEEMMKLTKDGKALYLHCLPADISGLSCPEGEVDNSVFDRYLVPLYKQASYKPYIIAAMIFLAQVKDPVKALMDLDSADNKRKMF